MQAGKLFNQVEDEGDNFTRSQPLSAHEEDLMNADVFGIQAFGRESKRAEDTTRNVTYCLIETIQKAQKNADKQSRIHL